jgi:hypothetical protein
MAQLILVDVAPDPLSIGATLAVLLFVVGFIGLLFITLVVFLWYRKRSRRRLAMIRPISQSTSDVQPSNPNQP